jgi:hypothetical protein
MPCPVAKGLECVFPIWFTQCGRVWFTLAMPRPYHALTMSFFSRPRHSTAVDRRPVGYLPAFGFFRLPRGISRRTRHCRSTAGARHGTCELTHGMAGERHGNGMGTACYVWFGPKSYFITIAQSLHSLTHNAPVRDCLPYWTASARCPLLTFSHLNLSLYIPSYLSPTVPEHTLTDRP